MKTKYFVMLGIIVLLVGSVTAIRTADYYYSPTCPHCQKVSPFIDLISQTDYSTNWNWNFYDITKGSYDIDGVPTLIFDNLIKLQGSYEIPRYAECYLKEQSSLNCPTYSADTCTNDWFMRN